MYVHYQQHVLTPATFCSDKLFDSVNGSAIKSHVGKKLCCSIPSDLEHLKFWHEATKVLRSIVYIKKDKQFVPPTVPDWIITIRGLEYLWTCYRNKLSFLCLQHFNPKNLQYLHPTLGILTFMK